MTNHLLSSVSWRNYACSDSAQFHSNTIYRLCCCERVIPEFRRAGLLPDGIHLATWKEFVERFGKNTHRQGLLGKFRQGLLNLRDAGCLWVYIDGSFTTKKPYPADVDGCWEYASTVDVSLLDEAFLLKARKDWDTLQWDYKMDFRPTSAVETSTGKPFPDFFQETEDGTTKGIIKLELHTV